jgi:hypothetical protein
MLWPPFVDPYRAILETESASCVSLGAEIDTWLDSQGNQHLELLETHLEGKATQIAQPLTDAATEWLLGIRYIFRKFGK